jgi:hypothetical protein
MSDVLPLKIDAAMTLSTVTASRLALTGNSEVANKLVAIVGLVQGGSLFEAFEAYRNLPRYDVADFWESMDWMIDEHERVPAQDKALTAAYYNQTLKALGDLRVSVLYGFQRPLVDSSPVAVKRLALDYLEALEMRANGT